MEEQKVRPRFGSIEIFAFSNESFSESLLEFPQYTRPLSFEGMEVPKELLSGHHKKIVAWRQNKALKSTKKKRPDLLLK